MNIVATSDHAVDLRDSPRHRKRTVENRLILLAAVTILALHVAGSIIRDQPRAAGPDGDAEQIDVARLPVPLPEMYGED